MATKLIMKKIGLLLAIVGLMNNLQAAGGGETQSANIRSDNKISLQSGARTYMNYCLACHSLKYMRYETLVEGLGVSPDIIEKNLMFTGERITDHITNNLPENDSKAWFGKAPPDLTLIARVRGADWLYTYLKSFYADENRPLGVNNSLFKDVGMPHVLAPLQGKQVKSNLAKELESKIASADLAIAIANRDKDDVTAASQRVILDEATLALGQLKHEQGYFEIATAGSMNADEYDETVRDLVNFMDYAAEPIKLERKALGLKVILFLIFLFGLTYLLKKEYWKDIH
ncbi:MAG: ubiquinol-cytochrome c reductase cytochrome c1 subunit [Enterobacterales bacterium]|jgi:ubiquinol-cytochrome c reductase cytochrome c1 subunit